LRAVLDAGWEKLQYGFDAKAVFTMMEIRAAFRFDHLPLESSMNDTVFEPGTTTEEAAGSRRHHEDDLVLNEIDALSVIERPADPDMPCELITFGNMRETCPKCKNVHLKLVLRQANVRAAHLLCPQCDSCFDAHHANGSSAFSI
jgi:hypothetical protein